MPRFLNEIKENEMEVPHSSNGSIKNEVYLSKTAFNLLVENNQLEPNTIYHVEGYEAGTISAKEILDIAHPQGSLFETHDSNFNPNVEWEDTKWVLANADHKRDYVGSQQLLLASKDGTGAVSSTNIIGAYGYELVSGLFKGTRLWQNNVNEAEGFHREVRLSFQATTGGDTRVFMALNNEETTEGIRTWSGPTFRALDSTNYIDLRHMTLEPTFNYTSNPGINLKYRVVGDGTWTFMNPTVHGYIVENAVTYSWKRVEDDHIFTQDECQRMVYKNNNFTYCSNEGSDDTGYTFSIRNRETTAAYGFYHVNKYDLTVTDVT